MPKIPINCAPSKILMYWGSERKVKNKTMRQNTTLFNVGYLCGAIFSLSREKVPLLSVMRKDLVSFFPKLVNLKVNPMQPFISDRKSKHRNLAAHLASLDSWVSHAGKRAENNDHKKMWKVTHS